MKIRIVKPDTTENRMNTCMKPFYMKSDTIEIDIGDGIDFDEWIELVSE
jgi:hypothetical protein